MVEALNAGHAATAPAAARAAVAPGDDQGDEDDEQGGPGPLEDGGELPGGNQGELTIAIDDTGRHIVIGFNDFRGFSSNPLSVSGFMYSDDGGRTFVDGGQLPVTTGTTNLGGTLLPQIFGDPDVKYLGGCNFIYSSLLVVPFGAGSAAQTVGIHRSTDCGHTWEGPFEVTPVTNPNDEVDVNGDPIDAADKELMDVNRLTGRVMLTWTNFSERLEISRTYSDNVLAATPTWSARVILGARDEDGQASVPRSTPRGKQNRLLAPAGSPWLDRRTAACRSTRRSTSIRGSSSPIRCSATIVFTGSRRWRSLARSGRIAERCTSRTRRTTPTTAATLWYSAASIRDEASCVRPSSPRGLAPIARSGSRGSRSKRGPGGCCCSITTRGSLTAAT
jgi:hypothetical protein